jgi:hypothetical protein
MCGHDRARPDHDSVEVRREPVGLIGRPRPDAVKQTPIVGIQFPEPIGLQPISQNMKQQVAGQVRGCSPPERRVPSRSQHLDVETAQTRDLGVERSPSGTAGSITTRAMAFKLRDAAKGGTQNGQRRRG